MGRALRAGWELQEAPAAPGVWDNQWDTERSCQCPSNRSCHLFSPCVLRVGTGRAVTGVSFTLTQGLLGRNPKPLPKICVVGFCPFFGLIEAVVS